MPQAYKWEPWPEAAEKSEAGNMLKEWNVPGVYALVAARREFQTVLSEGSRILYIGETEDLRQRIGTRVKGKRSHSVLWYLDDAMAVETEMPKELRRLLSEIESTYVPKVYALNLVSDPPNAWNNGKHKSVNKMLEEVLLIQHLFTFGQFPPLNAMTRSIMSIYAYWTPSWWQDFWKNPQNWESRDKKKEKLPKGFVEKCWKELNGLLKKK